MPFLILAGITAIIILRIRSVLKRKALLFSWASVLFPGITKESAKRMSAKQLSSVTVSQIQQRLRIVNDCIELINTTVDPDTYFPRLALAIEHLRWISSVTRYASIGKFSLTGNLDAMLSKLTVGRQELISEFLDRYWASVCTKSMKFATQKTRIKKVSNALEPLQKHAEAIGNAAMEQMRLRVQVFQDVCSQKFQLQKDLVKSYPAENHDQIRSILYSLDKYGCIKREKSGSTYTLSVP